MTRSEMQSAIRAYCNSCDACSECILNKEGFWEKPCNGTFYCLDIIESSDHDLARAVALIEGKNEPVADDPVNRPSHYTQGGIECIDAIEASMSLIEYAGFLKGQVIKYTWRYRHKGKPAEDLKKARFYLDRLIAITEKEEAVDND